MASLMNYTGSIIFINRNYKIEKEEISPNSFYDTSLTLM